MRGAKILASMACVLAPLGCGDGESPAEVASSGGAGGQAGAGGAVGVQISGLSAPVEVSFDDRGIPSMSCQTNADCIATLGYFHARDRFVQMDLRRRISTGRLSQVIAEGLRNAALNIDVENRGRYSTRTGEPLESSIVEKSDAETQAMMEAYSRGVNAWIADVKAGRNGAQFPREYQHTGLLDYDAARIPEWTPSDCVATILALVDSLTNRAGVEIERGRHRAELKARFGDVQGETMFRDLFDIRPDIDSPILPGFGSATASLWHAPNRSVISGNPALPPGPGPHRGLLDPLLPSPERESGIGSNNWVVSPDKSATGNAFLSNDPHLGMSNPALAYLAQLDSKTHGTGDLHVAGMTFAGMPFVLIGQNEHLAWGATNSNFDLTDVYVEEVSADEGSVTFKNSQVPIIEKKVSFTFSDGSSVERELQFVPHHGPVLPRKSASDPMMTLRWTGNDIDTDVNFLMKLAKAKDVFEAQTALKSITGVGSNWVVADVSGNIGYFPYNRVPKRPWATGYSPASGVEAVPWLPLDGRGDFEWESYYSYDELPQVINPDLGYVATANNDMTGALFDGDPTDAPHGVFQTNIEAGYRHRRIMDLLGATDAHDMASMEALVSDTHSLIGEQLVPHLLTAASSLSLSAAGQKVLSALAQWKFGCPTGLTGTDGAKAPLVSDAAVLQESAGCAAFHVVLLDINHATVDDEGVIGERGPNLVVVKMLKGEPTLEGGEYWDDVDTPVVETKDDILTASFDAAGEYLVKALGDDETQWAWGRIHTVTLRSDLDTASGGLVHDFNEYGFANDGGMFTVDVANPTDDITQAEGAAMRFVCEAKPDRPHCTIQLPGGESSHPDSPHYLDMLPDYLANVSRPLPMDVDAERESAETTMVLTPAP